MNGGEEISRVKDMTDGEYKVYMAMNVYDIKRSLDEISEKECLSQEEYDKKFVATTLQINNLNGIVNKHEIWIAKWGGAAAVILFIMSALGIALKLWK